MGIQIVSLFGKPDSTEEPIDAEIDESLTLEDLLFICGHRALGLSEKEAREIDSQYGKYIDRPI